MQKTKRHKRKQRMDLEKIRRKNAQVFHNSTGIEALQQESLSQKESKPCCDDERRGNVEDSAKSSKINTPTSGKSTVGCGKSVRPVNKFTRLYQDRSSRTYDVRVGGTPPNGRKACLRGVYTTMEVAEDVLKFLKKVGEPYRCKVCGFIHIDYGDGENTGAEVSAPLKVD